MKAVNDYKLTRQVTVGQLRNWLVKRDDFAKKKTIELIEHRFTNRYVKHLHLIDSGFLKMAVCCLTIETLESFKQGKKDTNGKSRKMFRDFFETEKINFPGFAGISDDFYENIRCGILHQAETTNAWRIVKSGPLLEVASKAINAKKFVEALAGSINNYVSQLNVEDWSSSYWKHAIMKLEDICDNCNVKK